jgi:rubrerythrin
MYPNKYIPKLVKEYIADEMADNKLYSELAANVNDSEVSELLKETSQEEGKHVRILEDVYYKLTGEEAENIAAQEYELQADFTANITKALMGELAAVEKYRALMFALEDEQLRDYIYEIISDEQVHADRMNYIYAKSGKNE